MVKIVYSLLPDKRLFIHVSNRLSGNKNAQMLVDHIKDNNNNNNQVFKT